jgi:phosphatidylinositol kinase/protein kinase (PI-3  family)
MMAFRRITFIGNDASKHTFTVQYHQTRVVRRDERLMQLIRVFNEYVGLNENYIPI